MGADSSKGSAVRKSVFTSSEREELDRLFRKIAGDGTDSYTLKQFKDFMRPKLPEDLCTRLFGYMKDAADVGGDVRNKKSSHKEEHVTRMLFEASVGNIVKGSSEEKAKLLMKLVQDAKIQALRPLLDVFLRLAELSLSASSQYASWKLRPKFSDKQFVSHYLFDLIIRDGKQQCDVAGGLSPESTFTIDDVERWLSKMPVVTQIMNLALHQCFPVVDISQFSCLLPKCDVGASRTDPVSILDLPSVIFINSALPHQLRTEWRLLFSAALHGASFATMLKRILGDGPTILVVKDRGGHIFGGFASEAWSPHANFYGSSYCFLFSLLPLMDAYFPTGYNTNFMYINQNQQTLPNGLGMGGQWNYAGLWIDHEYGRGHSKAKPKCTTYNSPQLSSEPEFTFDLMEVWAVGPKPRNPAEENESPEQNSKQKSGVLNMDPETKALLEMIGKGQHSEAIREADAKADEKKPK